MNRNTNIEKELKGNLPYFCFSLSMTNKINVNGHFQTNYYKKVALN